MGGAIKDMRCNFVANGNLKLCRAEELRFAGFVTSQDFETGRRMMGSIGDSGDDRNNKKTRDRRLGKVDVEDLLNFIFPLNLQHPLSTGRLYAFGMYGPLDEDGNLRAGHNGQRVVSGWELDTMCLQFEREDILQVGGYVDGIHLRLVCSFGSMNNEIIESLSWGFIICDIQIHFSFP